MMDTINRHVVGFNAANGHIAIGLPPMGFITPDEALMFAAWLIVLARKQDKIAEAIEAIENV